MSWPKVPKLSTCFSVPCDWKWYLRRSPLDGATIPEIFRFVLFLQSLLSTSEIWSAQFNFLFQPLNFFPRHEGPSFYEKYLSSPSRVPRIWPESHGDNALKICLVTKQSQKSRIYLEFIKIIMIHVAESDFCARALRNCLQSPKAVKPNTSLIYTIYKYCIAGNSLLRMFVYVLKSTINSFIYFVFELLEEMHGWRTNSQITHNLFLGITTWILPSAVENEFDTAIFKML